ncbi:hypothetical protein BC939DRAFT_454095 [Gamsiella multidivaricata]|uniref:uncharacterized protein n=1 Tax=Gamsiella multidivaricata TaxID=101098 RepID=UPI002220C79E|nr:uncharacterized protein BC939DRAFT_454095 [Gamsiella multidivaricata]KAI7822138.1 hypothetical protein BC939DRAFT_454095 [Gamsiella multidivaricata]
MEVGGDAYITIATIYSHMSIGYCTFLCFFGSLSVLTTRLSCSSTTSTTSLRENRAGGPFSKSHAHVYYMNASIFVPEWIYWYLYLPSVSTYIPSPSRKEIGVEFSSRLLSEKNTEYDGHEYAIQALHRHRIFWSSAHTLQRQAYVRRLCNS